MWEPTALSASMGIPTMVSCNGGSDGSVTVTGSGGTVAEIIPTHGVMDRQQLRQQVWLQDLTQ